MPLLNCASGRVSAILLYNKGYNNATANFAVLLKHRTGSDVFMLIKDDVRIPDEDIKLLSKAGISYLQLLRADFVNLANIVDYVMPFYLPDRQMHLAIHKNASESKLDQLLRNTFVSYHCRDDSRDIFLKGGDYIAGGGFLILGPEMSRKYPPTSNLWSKFLYDYGYPNDFLNSGKVLFLGSNTVHSDESVYYHLDLYLTYAGVHDQRHLFFISKVHLTKDTFFLNSIRTKIEYFFGSKNVLLVEIPALIVNGQHCFSYNNMLVSAGLKQCYMPYYTVSDSPPPYSCELQSTFDEAASTIRHFLEPIPVPVSYGHVTLYKQSLHCMAAVVSRMATKGEALD